MGALLDGAIAVMESSLLSYRVSVCGMNAALLHQGCDVCLLYMLVHLEHIYGRIPDTLSREISPVEHCHVLQHSGFYHKHGVCPKHVPNNMFSLHSRRGAEE